MDPDTVLLVKTLGQFGVLGVVVIILSKVALKLYATEKEATAAAAAERDALRGEREKNFIEHIREMSKQRETLLIERHSSETVLRAEVNQLREQHLQERLHLQELYASKLEKVNERMVLLGESLDTTLEKALGRRG